MILLLRHALLLTVLLTVFISAFATAQPRSGYEFITPESRAMQDDDFENPGVLTVDRGETLFNTRFAHSGKACADCHGGQGEGFDTKKLARYPLYDNESGQVVTLQRRIAGCRTSIAGQALPTDHADLVALETFVRNLARGEKVNVSTDGAVAPLLKQGEALYKTRYGLIDMACYHCHDLYPGQRIRGQTISEGQANGFPAYRLDTGEVTSLSQRIRQCLTLMRAEPFAADSKESRLLQLYIMSRSNGLAIETPAVRY